MSFGNHDANLSLGDVCVSLLLAALLVASYVLLHAYLPVEDFMHEHSVLGPLLVYGGPLVVLALLTFLLALPMILMGTHCPACGRDFKEGYEFDLETRTVKCTGCGEERDMREVLSSEDIELLLAAVRNKLQDPEKKEEIDRIRRDLLGIRNRPRYTGLDTERGRNLWQLLWIMTGCAGGAVTGGLLGGAFYGWVGGFIGLVAAMATSGMILLVRHADRYR